MQIICLGVTIDPSFIVYAEERLLYILLATGLESLICLFLPIEPQLGHLYLPQ